MTKNNKCFIIQPLSEPYKERCDQTYKPAIEKAGLSPYRVDEHYDADKLIIEKIQDEIKSSIVCLADIRENNANVWYEIGFADGHDIPVVLICEKVNYDRLPFDLNQRDVYFYRTDSQGDWQALQKEISKRLKSAIKQKSEREENDSESVNHNDINEAEIEEAQFYILSKFYDNPFHLWTESDIFNELTRWSFSHTNILDAFYLLKYLKFISSEGKGEEFHRLTDKGRLWCIPNKEPLMELDYEKAPLDYKEIRKRFKNRERLRAIEQ